VGDHYNWENQDDIFKRINGSRTGSSGKRGDSVSSGTVKVRSTSGSSDLRGIANQLENSAEGVRKEYTEKFGWEKGKVISNQI
jgi:hypothetical protein